MSYHAHMPLFVLAGPKLGSYAGAGRRTTRAVR